ncbi:MAG: AAA family ATPase [Bacteroidota bacterium]
MQELFQKSDRLITNISTKIQRTIPASINWDWRLNALFGARGTGKTTLLLQRAKYLKSQNKEVLYVSLDDLYFTENRLLDLVDGFQRMGGNYLFVDEVHKYPGWARELKNIYDNFPDLIVTFSGSSILEIFKQEVDLSRRALRYELPGLSFREYLAFTDTITLEPISFEDLIHRHRQIAAMITSQIKPIPYFKQYLQSGYYPFFMEQERDYTLTLSQIIQLIVESDLRTMEGFDTAYSRKILQLLRIIAGTAPFKPNISKLSERIGITRKTLLQYLHYLHKARLTSALHLPEKHIGVLQKPDKLFLQNPNLYYAIHPTEVEVGSVRETFFQNQMSVSFEVHLHKKADFSISHQGQEYIFEVGGRNKKSTQINDLENAYLALDDTETGYGNRIPLWLFGLLY